MVAYCISPEGELNMSNKLLIMILLLCVVGIANSYSADTDNSQFIGGENPKIPDILMPKIPDIPKVNIPTQPAVSIGIPSPSSLIVTGKEQIRQTTISTSTEEVYSVNRSPDGVTYAPDRIIVKYKSEAASANNDNSVSRAALNTGIGATVLANERQLGVSGMEVIQLPEGSSVQKAVKYYSMSPDVAYAEPDYIVHAFPVNELKVSVPINENALSYREQVGQTIRNPDITPNTETRSSSPQTPAATAVGIIKNEDEIHGYMHITPQERIQMLETSMLTPDLPNVQEAIPQGNVDLLQYIPYTGSQRNQGNCGNCWVWASTGAIEVAHTIQSGVSNRVSIQYFNSNYNGGTGNSWACQGGWAETFATFHSTSGYKQVIPWSNANANYADANACPGGVCSGTLMPASSISTTPNYPVTSISTSNIASYSVSQSQAIANIKAQINNNKAVWWAFWLPDSTSWNEFSSYWAYQTESSLWNPDPYNDLPYTSTGGGHAVLIVGYDDTSADPNQRYWKVLNSWGTTSGRPTGVFRVKMNMDYAGIDSDGYVNHVFKIFNIAYATQSQTGSISVTSSPSGARIWLDGVDTGKNAPNTLSSVASGAHTVALKLSGYTDYSTSVTVTGGQTTAVAGTLSAIQVGSLSIQSNPTGATIFIDNENQGAIVTPTTISSITPGSHSVKLTKSGYQDWTQSTAVTSGQTTQVSATMTAVTPDSSVIPNDPYFSYLYGLHNTGQTGGTADADIDAPEGWGVITGSSSVIVAIIDTGVDYSHPDLAANIWTDPVTGYHGYDYANYDNYPMDDNGHGTHCAGTVGAVGNNGIGVVGVNWNVKIMPMKFLDSYGSGYTSNAILAIQYANSHGAHVISNSWGGSGYSQSLKDAIDASSAVIVCAAGNDYGQNTDITPNYPSAYSSTNIIAVAATDNRDALATFSNYGPTTVDVMAPGVSIYSTYPISKGSYTYMSGTSMATPHVAGVAALVKASAPSYSAYQVKQAIINGVDKKSELSGLCVSGGRVNIKNSLPAIQTEKPTITSITPASGVNTGSVSITNLAGTNFKSGAIVALTRSGQTNIPATGVKVVSSTKITCTFPITGKTAGLWNIAVQNTDSQIGIKNNGFTITNPSSGPDHIGVFRPSISTWYLDYDRNNAWSGEDEQYSFGMTSYDIPVTGEWSGDGKTNIGIFRGKTWYADYNGNGYWDAGDKSAVFGIGDGKDTPVTGEWSGDGKTNIGIFRGKTWYADYNGNGYWDAGDKSAVFGIGDGKDTPVTGDWNGDGKTNIGVFRGNTWYADYNGNGYWDAGDKSAVFGIGDGKDIPVTGDWNGDGKTNIGIVRANIWYLDYNGNGKWDGSASDISFTFGVGDGNDKPVTGKWSGTGATSIQSMNTIETTIDKPEVKPPVISRIESIVPRVEMPVRNRQTSDR
jgi:C1A family cysteine protease